MSELIAFAIGLVLGCVSGFLVYRNKARLSDLEHELLAANTTIDNLHKRLSRLSPGGRD